MITLKLREQCKQYIYRKLSSSILINEKLNSTHFKKNKL